MAQVSRRAGINGSALVRLLSRLTDIDVRESRQGTADQLSQWFGWTDAISLSAALDGVAASVPVAARASASASAEERECARLRAALAKAIGEDTAFTAGKERGQPPAAADFTPYRRRYVAQQQAMETGIGPLRGRLRAMLAARSPAMARLAAVDVVMEQVLAARERSLLSTVPSLLEKHFKRLHLAAQADQSDQARSSGADAPDEPPSGVQPGEWLDVFRKDTQNVLLAELDFRFQPVEGLLEALRTRQPECHD
ncbi:DUF3348 domain-containing protein [Variovorax paradoxus]|uniref:DUF3348 domain-containing protein n=1 Tax=Variovorax paradoxus TaxID=34073 RepID=UPI00339A1C27